VTSYTYNLANLVTSVTNGSISSYAYAYQLDGNKTRITDHTGKITAYAYDGLGRLTSESDTTGVLITYTYDAYNNRASMNNNGAVTAYTYDANNRLTRTVETDGDTVTTSNYSYDANGNKLIKMTEVVSPATGEETTVELTDSSNFVEIYEYDLLNRLVRSTANGVTASYAYRPDGMRFSKSANGETTTHIWDGANIVGDVEGAAIRVYIRGIGLIRSGGNHWYLFNGRGDVVQLANGAGVVLRTYVYDAFGVEREPDESDVNPWRYCAEYFDRETGTVYLRHRYYNPRLGRFMTEDPYWNVGNMIYGSSPFEMSHGGFSPDILAIMQSGNLYVYVMNNPVMFTDPTGLKAYSVKASGSRNKGKFTLFVEPRWLTNFQTGANFIPGVGLGTWGGLRLAGYRGISMDWTVGVGAVADVASQLVGGKIGAGITLLSGGISYAASRPEWQMREAVFNQFNRNIWVSSTRDTVDAKFKYAMNWMDGLLGTGNIEVRRAVDYFGSRAFRDNDRILRFDPLTGADRYFNQNDWYFFAINEEAHGAIGRAQDNMKARW
jgi:RHS repeat-associated protein